MTSRLIDVTPQVLEFHNIYGGSDNTNQGYTSSSRALNYSKGASIQKPEFEQVSDIPREIKFKDSVGLFGSENHFVKVRFNLQNPISGDFVINDYLPAATSVEIPYGPDPYTHANQGYDEPGQAFIDLGADLWIIKDDYEPATTSGDVFPNLTSAFFKVELKNLKTGNIYVDSWLDVRLYNKNYEEHPYDIMYVKHNEPFYIGFHARNTRRLPYNVLCEVGVTSDDSKFPAFGILGDFDNRYLATRR